MEQVSVYDDSVEQSSPSESAGEELWSDAQDDLGTDSQSEGDVQDPDDSLVSSSESDDSSAEQVSRPRRARKPPKRLTYNQVGEPSYWTQTE